MRKFLAILLAVLMVVPAFAFTASAEEATPAAQKLNIIPILTEYDMPDADMDVTTTKAWKNADGGNWFNSSNCFYDADERGVGITWTGATSASAGFVKFHYQDFARVDITDLLETGAICFDLYLSDPDALNVDTVTYDFELRSPGGNDSNEWNASKYSTLTELYGGELQAGWNHFEIPLSSFKLVDRTGEYVVNKDTGATAVDEVTPDPTQIYYFRFFNAGKYDMGGEGENTIMMKNIYFVDQCTYEAPEAPYDRVIDVWDCEGKTAANGGTVTYTQGSTQGGTLVDVDGDGDLEYTWIYDQSGNGGYLHSNGGWNDSVVPNRGSKCDMKFSLPIDTNEHFGGIQFDIYVSDTKVKVNSNADTEINETNCTQSLLSTTWQIELCSNGKSDQAEINWQWSLAQMFGDYIQPNTWYTVALDIDHFKDSDFSTTTSKTPEDAPYVATNTNYIRIYNLASFSYMGNATIAIDNIRAFRDVPEVEEKRSATFDLENNQGSSAGVFRIMNSTTTSGFISGGSSAMANKAIIVEHFKENVTEGVSRTSHAGKFTPIDATGMDTVCFDLYVNYYGSEANKGTGVSASVLGTMRGKWNRPFQIEIGSGGVCDTNEVKYDTTLAGMTGIAADSITCAEDVNGWHHVEIPISYFTDSSNNAYKDTDKYYINWEAVNYFAIFCTREFTAPAGMNLFVAVDNFCFKDSTYVAPEAPTPAIYVKTTPTLSNSFNLAYEISGNEYVISNPIVDVTFDGKTTTMGAAFSFEGILAHRLSDTIATTVTYLNADHQLMRGTLEYSIKQYAESRLGKTGDTTLDRLISDMLYYGAAAQSLIGYNTENLASDLEGILEKAALDTDKLAACKIENVIVGAAATEGPAFKSAALVLDSELAIRIAFTGEAESLTIGGETYGSADFVAADGYYYVDFPVSANNFDEVYTAYFNGNADYALTYSVNHYLATKYKTTSPLADLYAAIYNYGVSADAYATVTGQND